MRSGDNDCAVQEALEAIDDCVPGIDRQAALRTALAAVRAIAVMGGYQEQKKLCVIHYLERAACYKRWGNQHLLIREARWYLEDLLW